MTTPDGALPDDASRPEDAQSEDAQSDPMDLPSGVTLIAIARNADEPDEQD